MKTQIAPSILAADFLNIKSEIDKMKKAGIEMIHFDIMDGHFVPNITFGVDFLKNIRKCCSLIFDVHLMVTNPDLFIAPFAEAGADVILFHREVSDFPLRLIKKIKSLKKKAGITLNPVTKIETIDTILPELDQVLLMSVEPGFYGQAFIPFVLKKIESLKAIIVKNNYKTLIEVDGGINEKNKNDIISAGADILVMGAGFFKKK
ncbi:MAG: ribulose-phosphate 3-epimerase [Spirochaetes bacterium]|nr:ribulose-phosphate 3-epimerase [Spirochaetota bacterium]